MRDLEQWLQAQIESGTIADTSAYTPAEMRQIARYAHLCGQAACQKELVEYVTPWLLWAINKASLKLVSNNDIIPVIDELKKALVEFQEKTDRKLAARLEKMREKMLSMNAANAQPNSENVITIDNIRERSKKAAI